MAILIIPSAYIDKYPSGNHIHYRKYCFIVVGNDEHVAPRKHNSFLPTQPPAHTHLVAPLVVFEPASLLLGSLTRRELMNGN